LTNTDSEYRVTNGGRIYKIFQTNKRNSKLIALTNYSYVTFFLFDMLKFMKDHYAVK